MPFECKRCQQWHSDEEYRWPPCYGDPLIVIGEMRGALNVAASQMTAVHIGGGMDDQPYRRAMAKIESALGMARGAPCLTLADLAESS